MLREGESLQHQYCLKIFPLYPLRHSLYPLMQRMYEEAEACRSCLTASFQSHLPMAAPQSSSHSPHIASIFFGSLVLSPHLSSIVSSPYLSSALLSRLLGFLFSYCISSFMLNHASPCLAVSRRVFPSLDSSL